MGFFMLRPHCFEDGLQLQSAIERHKWTQRVRRPRLSKVAKLTVRRVAGDCSTNVPHRVPNGVETQGMHSFSPITGLQQIMMFACEDAPFHVIAVIKHLLTMDLALLINLRKTP